MGCPSCYGVVKENQVGGDYCINCGLIIATYQKSMKIKNKTKQRKSKKRKCRFCSEIRNLSIHHIVPKRTKKKTKKVILCQRCHEIADAIANELYPQQIDIIKEA